jgi:hypothetical protein
MNESNRKQIEERAWLRTADPLRQHLTETLALPVEASFLSRDESLAFGARYWSRVAEVELAVHGSESAILAKLCAQHGSAAVTWLHPGTNDAGAIAGTFKALMPCMQHESLRGSDLLFAALDLSFGFCYEPGENQTHFRYWGTAEV